MDDINNQNPNQSNIPPEAIVGGAPTETLIPATSTEPASSSTLPSDTPQSPKSNNGLVIVLCIIIGLLVAGGIGGYFYFSQKIADLSKKSDSVVEDKEDEKESEISGKTKAETEEIKSEIKKLDETIEKTENSSDPDDQKANAEAKLKKLQYELEISDFSADELDKALELVDDLEASISELDEVTQGEFDTSSLRSFIEALKMLKDYSGNIDTSIDWYQDLVNRANAE